MSLFGLQQMINMFRPAKATESFNHVTKATEEQFGDALKATFRAGDNLQKVCRRDVQVLTFGMFDRGGAQATASALHGKRRASETERARVSQAVDAVTQTVQSATSAAAAPTAKRRMGGDAEHGPGHQDATARWRCGFAAKIHQVQGQQGGADARKDQLGKRRESESVISTAKNMNGVSKEMRNA